MSFNGGRFLLGAGLLVFVLLSSPTVYAANVSGFINFEYNQFNIGGKSSNPDQNPPFGGFDLQRIGIDFEHDQDIFTAIAQLQIEHGAQFRDMGTGSGAAAASPTAFGEVGLERGWIQARFDELFHLKLGKELIPTLWEREHYPSLYMSISEPQIEENVFQEYIIGALAEGTLPWGFLYNLWLNNAENTLTSSGGHSVASDKTTLPPDYGGRFGWQNAGDDYSMYFGALLVKEQNVQSDTVYGFETALKWKSFSLWSEYSRALITRGYYLLPSYTFYLKAGTELTLYILFDSFNNDVVGPQSRNIAGFGLNYKPKPYLTLKAEEMWTQANNAEQASQAFRLGFIYHFD